MMVTCLCWAEYIVGLQEPGEKMDDNAFHELPNIIEYANLSGLVLSFPFFETGTRYAVFQTSGTSTLFQLRLKISRSVFLEVGPRCFSILLLTPFGPAACFGLRFLMA